MRYARPRSTEADFWSRVDKSGDCWRWLGAHYRGRGIVRMRVLTASRPVRAYQAAFAFVRNDGQLLPADTHLHHECGNAWCVNPDHLTPMTREEHDQLVLRTGCGRHGFEDWNGPRKQCRICDRERKRAARAAAKKQLAA